MKINRKPFAVFTITGLLVSGASVMRAANGDNRGDRQDKREMIQNLYSGSEEVKPPMAPPSSVQPPVIGVDKERSNDK